MTLREAKDIMLNYKDYYGFDFVKRDKIEEATCKEELNEIIKDHSRFLEDCLCDAQSSLKDFRKTIEVDFQNIDKPYSNPNT